MDQELLVRLVVALGLGLLAGLQRETSQSNIAGIRTFALIALFGLVSGTLSRQAGIPALLVGGLAALAFLLFIANYLKSLTGEPDAGQTTEVAVLLMYLLTAWLAWGHTAEVAVVGGLMILLLYLKEPLRGFAHRLSAADLRAIFQFVALSLVILPVLPNRTFGPYDVLNPFEIWLMVVLITGIGLVGYFLWKWLGTKSGMVLTGLLGGLISSTATTLSFARHSRQNPRLVQGAALVIVLASLVSIIRVCIEIGVVAAEAAPTMVWPFVVLLGAGALIAWWMYHRIEALPAGELLEHDNPAELKSALVFGLLYSLVVLAVAVAETHFGDSGLAVVSFLSGLTDMDAITLSLSNSVDQSRLDATDGSRYILLATAANTLFKGGLAASLGGIRLGKALLLPFGVLVALGLGLFWFL
ncbi:MAG: MgtC/SapB family protein [Bacteroidetes bacterium]|nr:MAG: MgtC/SapB family protein [Bacteroidota bacterium]